MELVKLAQKAVKTYLKEKRIVETPPSLSREFLKRKSGTFVTIKKEGDLRGCMGTYLPTQENIAQEVIRNAIAAANKDFRFGPVEQKELPKLSYTIYILSKPELVGEIPAPKEIVEKDLKKAGLNPKKYGVIVSTSPLPGKKDVEFDGHRVPKTGLLLPDLEGIDTCRRQVEVASQKARIFHKREKFLIYRFKVTKYP